jgi:hypothetical protein
MTLVSALLLLDSPLTEIPVVESSSLELELQQGVYLMTRDYLQNWLSWALHQPTPPDEVHRVKKALQLAAEAQGLTLESAFTEPGSIDAFPLSVEGHPLLLKPNMVVGPPKSVENGTSPLYCCAVPERFYEVRANFDSYIVVGNKNTITYFHFFLLHLHLHKSFTSCIDPAPPFGSRHIVRRWTFPCLPSISCHPCQRHAPSR